MARGHLATISIQVVRAMFATASSYGFEPDTLRERFDIARELWDDIDARVPVELVRTLWQEVPRLCAAPAFPLQMAELADEAGALTMFFYVVQSGGTLGEGLARAIRYERILQDVVESSFEVDGDLARFVHPSRARGRAGELVVPPPAMEFGFASMVLLARRATGKPLVPRAIAFEHAAPKSDAPYRRLFQAPIAFGARTNEMTFDRALLDLPLTPANPFLCELLERHARDLLARLPHPDALAPRVRQVLYASLRGGDPSLDAVRRALRMSARTLQRRLREEGTSHQELLDELRRELALRYVQSDAMNLGEIAFLLGFGDQSAFHRAFVRWTGSPPGEHRRALRQRASARRPEPMKEPTKEPTTEIAAPPRAHTHALAAPAKAGHVRNPPPKVRARR